MMTVPGCLCQIWGRYRVIVETEITRDDCIDILDPDGAVLGWNRVPSPPAGLGWFIHDDSHDRRTTWRRLILIPDINGGQ